MQKSSIEILVVEDEPDILELIEYHLQKEGYRVAGFVCAEHVQRFVEEESPALLIVDRNLPDIEGSELVSNLRKKGYTIPVIFLTAKDKQSDIEEGFLVGGDDYMSKPFNPKELLLRVEALLRRASIKTQDRIRYKDILLDMNQHTVSIDEKIVELTNLELKLLCTFIKNPQQTLERDFLRDEVWGDDTQQFRENSINVAINRLKKKIDPDGKKGYIAHVWGVGYRLV